MFLKMIGFVVFSNPIFDVFKEHSEKNYGIFFEITVTHEKIADDEIFESNYGIYVN